jgi:hypothetical protein
LKRGKMFIQYEVIIKDEKHEQGIINLDHVTSVQIEQHGGGYGKEISIYYLNKYEGHCIFILDDEEKLDVVYNSLCMAIRGIKVDMPGIGFFYPLIPV